VIIEDCENGLADIVVAKNFLPDKRMKERLLKKEKKMNRLQIVTGLKLVA
jgi:hypothetical protein